MGSQVKAICTCGFKKEIMIGGGMFTFNKIQYFPCLCENCQDIVQVNILEEHPSCTSCKSLKVTTYNNKQLIGRKGKIEVARSFDNVLTNGSYKCPKCKNNSLHFTAGDIHWD